MSVLEGKLVRCKHGTEGRVMAVALGKYVEQDCGQEFTQTGFFALLQKSDGTLTTVLLEDAEVVQPYETKPVPLPLAPGGATR